MTSGQRVRHHLPLFGGPHLNSRPRVVLAHKLMGCPGTKGGRAQTVPFTDKEAEAH